MKSVIAVAATAYLAGMASAFAAPDTKAPAATVASIATLVSASPVPKDPTVQGCFKSVGELKLDSKPDFNSRGECGKNACQAKGKNVAAMSDRFKCFCGDKYPPKSSLVDSKMCNLTCPGFSSESCGGIGYYAVYNTGLELYDVEFSDDSAAASTTGGGAAKTTLPGGETVFVTQSSDPDAGSSSKPNTAGIAAGVVVAVVVVAAAIGGVFFYMRRRRNQEIEDEHRRNAAVNSFINGSKPGSSAGYSISDTRLDPSMTQRRMSNGSISDNQDYSRKILRVTNA